MKKLQLMMRAKNVSRLTPAGVRALSLRRDGVRVPDAVGRGAGADEEDTGAERGKK